MSKLFKSISVLVMVCLLVIMVFAPAVTVNAETVTPTKTYIALGDSIGYGLSGGALSYTNLFAASLGISTYPNLSIPGFTTHELLPVIDANADLIKTGNIFTVSIGSNHLLGPVIGAIVKLYQLDPDDYPYDPADPNGLRMLSDLAARIYLDPDPLQTFSKLMNPQTTEAQNFNKALLAGVATFNAEWPAVIAKLRKLSPRSEVYVNTVYNPLRVSGTSDPLYPLYLKMEALIHTINLTIKAYALLYHYKVVDVYSAFKNSSEPVLSFSILDAITAVKSGNPAFLSYVDPHPTVSGHRVIFEKLTSVRNATPRWYWLLPVFG